jgi:hypothetical protein
VYAEPEGWSIISGRPITSQPRKFPLHSLTLAPLDIDDTIKVTMTSDPKGILRSTFVVCAGLLSELENPR